MKAIADLDDGRYLVTFADQHGAETRSVWESSDEQGGWNCCDEERPNVFWQGRADSRATVRALSAFRDRPR